MTDPFKPTQANWQELRQSVADQHEEGESTERRLARLEKKVGALEVAMGNRLEALTVSYQHLAAAFDKLVSRDVFDALRTQVNGLWVCVAIGVAVFLFRR